jgi:hypothetical protein
MLQNTSMSLSKGLSTENMNKSINLSNGKINEDLTEKLTPSDSNNSIEKLGKHIEEL